MQTYTYPRARIVAVHDGDTVIACIEVGFGITIQRHLRLLGINAPELAGESKAAGEASRGFLKGLVEGKDVVIAAATMAF